MNFEDFIKLGQVRRASRDEQLAKSLLKETVIDMEFFGDLEINEKRFSDKAETKRFHYILCLMIGYHLGVEREKEVN